jgi:hypothetical protein
MRFSGYCSIALKEPLFFFLLKFPISSSLHTLSSLVTGHNHFKACQSGDYDAAATWCRRKIPTASDIVFIPVNFTVIIPALSRPEFFRIEIHGTLQVHIDSLFPPAHSFTIGIFNNGLLTDTGKTDEKNQTTWYFPSNSILFIYYLSLFAILILHHAQRRSVVQINHGQSCWLISGKWELFKVRRHSLFLLEIEFDKHLLFRHSSCCYSNGRYYDIYYLVWWSSTHFWHMQQEWRVQFAYFAWCHTNNWLHCRPATFQ